MSTGISAEHPAPNSKPHPVVCVFCGASPGTSPAHVQAAQSLARAFHANNTHLVYGGGTMGVMGALAKELVRLSGPESVTGIIPKALMEYEQKGVTKVPSTAPSPTIETKSPLVAPEGDQKEEVDVPDPKAWGRTIVVPTMHARKALMTSYVLSGSSPGSGFIALSGGYGTLEELMEVVTWNQLGIHKMPVVLFNVEGYWDGITQWVNNAVSAGFVSQSNGCIIAEGKTEAEVMKALREYVVSGGRMRLRWGET